MEERQVRYVGLDVHKQFIMIALIAKDQKVILKPKHVDIHKFRKWAEEHLLNSTSKCNFESGRKVSCGKISASPTTKSKEHSWEHTHSLPTNKDTIFTRL